MADCRTCKYNSYLPSIKDWVTCSHPVTLAKTPKWEPGDPAFVAWRTSDIEAHEVIRRDPCAAHEPITGSSHG